MKSEVKIKKVKKQREVHGRRGRGKIITAVLEQETLFRATCVRQAAAEIG